MGEVLDKSRRGLKIFVFMLITVLNIFHVSGHVKQNDLIYMLMWTSSITDPFAWMDTDQDTFISRKCLYQNCFITNDMAYFNDITEFDVVLFNAVNLQSDLEIPRSRDKSQIYMFVGMQASSNYPVPETYNRFFNRTWTYKLDSDAYFGHIVVKDNQGKIIGPKKDMHWMNVKNMKPITKYIKHKLRKKSVAAAWFASNCKTNSKREDFVKRLKEELERYGQRIDIFGSCGDLECPIDRMDECFALIETDYYFYLAFENAFSEDYVTEQVLFALEHFAVPVVYGGANYTRFMPDGIYLDARKLGEFKLAKRMYEIMTNKEEYYDFFRWHRYYSFHGTEESPETDDFCVFCATMNDFVQRNESSVYLNLAQWWNGQVQVLEPFELMQYHEKVKSIPVKSGIGPEPKLSHSKKRLRFKGAKPFHSQASQKKSENGPNMKVVGSERQTIRTTLPPATRSQEKTINESITNSNDLGDGFLHQGKLNGSGSMLKEEFEFEYDYER